MKQLLFSSILNTFFLYYTRLIDDNHTTCKQFKMKNDKNKSYQITHNILQPVNIIHASVFSVTSCSVIPYTNYVKTYKYDARECIILHVQPKGSVHKCNLKKKKNPDVLQLTYPRLKFSVYFEQSFKFVSLGFCFRYIYFLIYSL